MPVSTSTTTSVPPLTKKDLRKMVEMMSVVVPPVPDVIVTTEALRLRIQDQCHRRPELLCGPFVGTPIVSYPTACGAKAAALVESERGKRVLLVTDTGALLYSKPIATRQAAILERINQKVLS